MGDRYTLTASAEDLNERFTVEIADAYKQRYNAAPTQLLPTITQESKGISFFYWGVSPEFSKNRSIAAKLLYVPVEQITEKASYKKLLKSTRCIIPSDGFYAWKKVSKRGRIPYRFVYQDGITNSFPGLWEEYEDQNGERVHAFKIITSEANEALIDLEDRMPIVFEEKQERFWLSDTQDIEALSELLQPYPAGKLSSYTVSPRFNDVSLDNPDLIKPFAAADQFGNYSLFD